MARPQKIDDEQVLDRAMSVFWHHGWSATSIRRLEDELDLRAPSIYRRFGSKDGLAEAVLERYRERIIGRRLSRYLTGEGDPIENVWSFLDSALTPRRADEPLLGCLLTVTALEGPGVANELAPILARGLQDIEQGLTAELARAESDDLLAPGTDAATAAAHIALAFQGLMVLARSGQAPDDLRARAATVLDTVTRRSFEPR